MGRSPFQSPRIPELCTVLRTQVLALEKLIPTPPLQGRLLLFAWKKKPPKTYIHKFKHYFSFNKYEETRIYTSRAGSSFYNVKMTVFKDNMGEQIFKSKKPWEVTSFQYKSKENEDGFTVNTLCRLAIPAFFFWQDQTGRWRWWPVRTPPHSVQPVLMDGVFCPTSTCPVLRMSQTYRRHTALYLHKHYSLINTHIIYTRPCRVVCCHTISWRLWFCNIEQILELYMLQ